MKISLKKMLKIVKFTIKIYLQIISYQSEKFIERLINRNRTGSNYSWLFFQRRAEKRGPPRILIQIIILAIVPSDYIQKREEKKEEKKRKGREGKKERNGTKHNEHLITGGQNPSHKSLRSVIEFLLRRRIEGTSLVSLLFPPWKGFHFEGSL